MAFTIVSGSLVSVYKHLAVVLFHNNLIDTLFHCSLFVCSILILHRADFDALEYKTYVS